ncbi:putative DeoR-family transcriptional regulator [Streptomyces himastatinicus ATCC 53653]|uniref:Putative DeoR-family transcriptional regulator n=1 Tax=Streptomyces himastatinicus ATCC 53653 TaxID=457427 RepID=D9WWJ9_9ACTN|nr:putative DeoR-family transcriptional regulator [Streptomyces himastatinicus ATCC 53653]
MTSTVHDVLAERRHQMILRALRSGGPAAVADLSAQLNVSAATIRRDLLKLEEDGLLTRVHGGAVVEGGDQPFAEVAEVRVADKDAIAVRAAGLVEDGQTVLLDIGTTAYRLARQLHGRRLTVITSKSGGLRGAGRRHRHRAGAARRGAPARVPLAGRLPHRGQPAPAARRLALPGHQRRPPRRPSHGHHGRRGPGSSGP